MTGIDFAGKKFYFYLPTKFLLLLNTLTANLEYLSYNAKFLTQYQYEYDTKLNDKGVCLLTTDVQIDKFELFFHHIKIFAADRNLLFCTSNARALKI